MLYVVSGPPAAGKSTWVLTRARPVDIVIDFDRLAHALTGANADAHNHTAPVLATTRAARKAALGAALPHRHRVDVYVIHSAMTERDHLRYARLGAEFVVIDPGQAVVVARCQRARPAAAMELVRRWYGE